MSIKKKYILGGTVYIDQSGFNVKECIHKATSKLFHCRLVPNHNGINCRFIDQASFLAENTHPNLVKVIEVFDHKNFIFIIEEHTSTCDLNYYLTMNYALIPFEEKVSLFRQIISLVTFISSHNRFFIQFKPKQFFLSTIVHSNIFLKFSGLSLSNKLSS